MESKTPFFSIIIPCYNSGPYIGHLLQSIVDQHIPDDIQVILSDDCSTEPYDKQVEPFLSQLHIKRVSTDYNCCPGNTRQRGVDNASGIWICFADHDDEFLPDTLKIVKDQIIKNNIEYYAKTTFYEIMRDTGEVVQIVDASKGLSWNHGKFYNLNNLWKKYNIHFIKDLLSHEDVAITAQVNMVMRKYDLPQGAIDVHTYNWLKNTLSLSNKRYHWKEQTDRERSFLECFFQDYLVSTGWLYLDAFKKEILESQQEQRKPNEQYLYFLRDMIISSIVYGFYYTESFLQEQGPYFVRQNFIDAGRLVYQFFQNVGGSVLDLENYLKSNIAFFDNIKQSAIIATGPVIPTHGFKEWIELVLFMYYPEKQITVKVAET